MADRIDDLTQRLETVETKLGRLSASVEQRFDQVDAKMDGGFGHVRRIERKLDQFIDVQLQANQLVDRRLRALEEQRLGPSEAE